MSTGTAAGFRATAGIILGYCVHSLLVALGLAAVVAASPLLFEIIRWTGISYLVFLAAKLVRASMRPGGLQASRERVKDQLYKGFLTSLLNPKGMLVYWRSCRNSWIGSRAIPPCRRCCCRRRSCSGARWCIRRCASGLADLAAAA
ncbi:LysE family transporter [Achromobacter xylosoxidans]